MRDEITAYKTLREQREQQIEQLVYKLDKHEAGVARVTESVRVSRKKLGKEAGGVNSRMGNLEQSLKVLMEESKTRLKEEVDKL